jgi:hypothetical protein
LKHPNSNIQVPDNIQYSNFKLKQRTPSDYAVMNLPWLVRLCLELGFWSFSGAWMLEFGIFAAANGRRKMANS